MYKFINSNKILNLFLGVLVCNLVIATSTKAFSQNNLVGSLEGEFVVSPSGTASYSIPIEVVPGTHGMQPQLYITYNSASGRGMLGMGWTLAGFSSISRIARDTYHDGNVGSVNFDGDDRYVLDGERLMRLANGSYAVENAVYGTETENFSRITLKNTPDTQTQYFLAVTDQGQIIEYGNTTNSKLRLPQGGVLSWMVNKVTDAEGNYMTFEYDKDSETKEIWPYKINYTGNTAANLSAYATVSFSFINDPNENKTYIGGNSITTTKLLKRIFVKYGTNVVRQYEMEYDFGRITRLTAVVMQDASGNELTRTNIVWNEDYDEASFRVIYGLGECNVQTGDFNGDNITDLFLSIKNPDITSWSVKTGDSSGNYNSTTWSGTISGFINFQVLDVEGDGRDEIGYVIPHGANNESFDYKTIRFLPNLITETFDNNETSEFLTGDFKGEGGIQTVRVSSPSGSYKTYSLKGSNASFNFNKDSDVSVTDINGNGKADIQFIYYNKIYVYEYDSQTDTFVRIVDYNPLLNTPSQCFYGDFNGDGMVDIIYYTYDNGTGHWYLKVSKGNDYNSRRELPFDTHYNNDTKPKYPLLISDVNGDGKDDIIQPTLTGNSSLILNVYYIRGYIDSGLVYDTIQVRHSGITNYYSTSYQFADLNGDGKNELFYTGSIFQNPIVVNLPERREYGLVSSVTNGLGKTTSLEYLYCNSPLIGYLGQYGKRIHYPLVSKLRQPDGIGGISTTTYTYNGAIFDYGRRQMLGFSVANICCKGTNNKLVFTHNTVFHHLCMIHSLTYYLNRSESETGGYNSDTNYWNLNRDQFFHYEIYNTPEFHSLAYGRFIPYNSITSSVNRLENKKETTYCWLKENGRVWKSSVWHRKAKAENGLIPWISRDSTEYDYTTVNLPNGVTVMKPSNIKTWNKRKDFNQMPIHLTAYTYSSGRLTQVETSDSDGIIGQTTYTYNGFGDPLTETFQPYGLTSRTVSYVYDPTGRFIVRETDVLGHSVSATFDERTGLLTTETDANGLTTSYQYDAFGRLTSTIRPDQTIRNIDYRWNNILDFPNAVYYSRVTEPGTPETRTYYDILGRTIHSYQAGCGYDDIIFDDIGRITRQTETPYDDVEASSQSKRWRRFGYDNYNRMTDQISQYSSLSYTYYDHNNPSYQNYFVSVVDGLRNTRQTTTYDALGRPIQCEDEGGCINYSYAYQTTSGHIRDITTISLGNTATTVVSDIRGNRLSIQDPDAGTVSSTYNTLNQLVTRTDANGNQASYTYDLGGRTTQVVYSKNTDTETVNYTYDNATGAGVGKLTSVQHDGNIESVYVYDNLGRLSNRKVYDGMVCYNHLYEYNTLGQLQYLTYPDGFRIRYDYNSYGELWRIQKASDNSLVFSVDTRNKFRQPKKCRYGNDTGIEYSYNPFGLLTGIKNGDIIQNNSIDDEVEEIDPIDLLEDPDVSYTVGDEYRRLSYSYNQIGFITTRADANVNQTETYYYDNLDRLVSYEVNGTAGASYSYANNGNILSNSNVGDYSYLCNKPHAVTNIEGISGRTLPPTICEASYNMRNKPTTISQNGITVTLDYDASGMRRHTQITNGQAVVKQKDRVSSLYEKETGIVDRHIDYIIADGQVVAVHIKEGSTENLYYVLTDHLGSWNKVMDENKNIVQQTHFDPWGNRMTYTNWALPQTQTDFAFDRGFTGHEHYDRIHVINANARLYDPVIGRFFSPDPFVQAPDFTQNYNRYSYCLNNPVMYTDPTGEVFGIDDLIAAATLGAIFNAFTQIVAGNVNGVGDFFVAAGIGALSGAAGAYVGSAVGGAIKYGGFISGAASGAASGATSGFIVGSGNAWMQGKSFGQGLKEGGIAAGIGLGSGALFGGLTQGYIDHKQGYSFWDGTKMIGTETVSIASNAEPITQLGDDDCLATTIEWTDHSLGGNMTYNEANSFIDYGTDGALDLSSVQKYCLNKGYQASYVLKDASAADKYNAVYSKIKNGGRVIINENLGHVSGHAVGVRSVTRTLYLSTKGACIPRYNFNVMDPFWGGYYNITQGMVRKAYRIILIL